MIDLYKPTISGKIIGGKKLLIQATDKESSVNVTGCYSGDSTLDNRSFAMQILQQRGSDVLFGWVVQSQHLTEILPVNSEIWNLTGKINYSNMICKGTLQRMSSSGRILGKMNFKSAIGNSSSIVLNIIGLRGQINFTKANEVYQKPEYRTE